MINLKELAGIDIMFNKTNNSLIFTENIPPVKPDIRKKEEMRKVLISEPREEEFYYMYRDICYKIDKEEIMKANVRYDITIIPNILTDNEFNKTVGHFHPIAKDNVTYPEVYEVIIGKAYYLFQKSSPPDFENIEEVILVEAKSGDKVLIPPNYGHITINISNETLVMANWLARDFTSIYTPFIKYHGGCYYCIKEDKNIKIIRNKNYEYVPGIKKFKANELNLEVFGLYQNIALYHSFFNNKQKFRFLTFPEEFIFEFEKLYR